MPNRYETREVLAGAYLNPRYIAEGKMRSHTVVYDEAGRYMGPLCRVKPESIADRFANPEILDQPPTCPTCAKRDPRFPAPVAAPRGTEGRDDAR